MTHTLRRSVAFSVLALAMFALAPLGAMAFQSSTNAKLLAAVEPFEGLTETAIAGDAKKIDRAIQEADKIRTATRALLPADAASRYDALFTALHVAQTKHDNLAVALQAAEIYKLLVSWLDASAMTVPKEVSLLDYSGFRTNALLKATPPDWTAIAATAQEANGYWAKVRDRVSDKKLQAGMDKAQQGLAAAAKGHDAALSRSSTKADLDLVDELEAYFAKAAKK